MTYVDCIMLIFCVWCAQARIWGINFFLMNLICFWWENKFLFDDFLIVFWYLSRQEHSSSIDMIFCSNSKLISGVISPVSQRNWHSPSGFEPNINISNHYIGLGSNCLSQSLSGLIPFQWRFRVGQYRGKWKNEGGCLSAFVAGSPPSFQTWI